MKKILKAQEPTELQHYKHMNPQATWSQFRKNKTRYNAVKNQIKKDQGALCAYCEIDLKESVISNDDFRVKHFHPKNDNSGQINWALEWSNVLGCCHGGSERNVVDAKQRFTSSAERHCDVPKKGNNLSGVRCRSAVQEMRVGPSHSACRSRVQTTVSGVSQKLSS